MIYEFDKDEKREIIKMISASNLEELKRSYNDKPIEIQSYLNCTEARKRNCIVRIFHFLKKKQPILDNIEGIDFTLDEIKKNFVLKESDLFFFKNDLFKISNENITLKNEIIEEIKKLDALTKIEFDENLIKEYCELFSEYQKEPSQSGISALSQKASIIHKHLIPTILEELLYSESKYINPEENPERIYSDFFSLDELYKTIMENKGYFPENGDDNLKKKMDFRVYSNRWGHYDTYRITRTMFGWDVTHISVNGPSLKDGSGRITENLTHDSIFYPKYGVQEAFEILWEKADSTHNYEERLQEKLQDIADWISETEKARSRGRPEWMKNGLL